MVLHPRPEGLLGLRHEGAQARGLLLQALRAEAGGLGLADGALLRAHVRADHQLGGNGGAGVGDGVGGRHPSAEGAGDCGEDPPCAFDDAVVHGVAGLVDAVDARGGGFGDLIRGLEVGAHGRVLTRSPGLPGFLERP